MIPYYEWIVEIKDIFGKKDTIKVWAQDEDSAKEDAIYSTNLHSIQSTSIIKADDLKENKKEKVYSL